MSNVVDSIILILLMFGAVIGWKKGLIKSAVSFFGTIICLIIAFSLKDTVSEVLYNNLPFFNFGGNLEGVTVLNILIYEGIAFLIVFSILQIILRVVVFASGIIEKLLNLTIFLGFFSKTLGLIFGFIEYYLIIFVALFVLGNVTYTSKYIEDSNLAQKILLNTPFLKGYVADEMNAIKEILSLTDKYKNKNNSSEAYNKDAFEILMKHHVISEESAKKLVDSKKINIEGSLDIINKYKDVINNG